MFEQVTHPQAAHLCSIYPSRIYANVLNGAPSWNSAQFPAARSLLAGVAAVLVPSRFATEVPLIRAIDSMPECHHRDGRVLRFVAISEYLSPVSLRIFVLTTCRLLSSTTGATHLSSLGRPEKTMIDDVLRQNWSTLHSALIDLYRKQTVTESSPRRSPFSGLAS